MGLLTQEIFSQTHGSPELSTGLHKKGDLLAFLVQTHYFAVSQVVRSESEVAQPLSLSCVADQSCRSSAKKLKESKTSELPHQKKKLRPMAAFKTSLLWPQFQWGCVKELDRYPDLTPEINSQ